MNPYDYVCNLQKNKVTIAQESLEAALLSLLDEKELHKISVKELCDRGNVARSTFYTYYDVIDDCLLMMENRFLCELIELNTEIKKYDKIENMELNFLDGGYASKI